MPNAEPVSIDRARELQLECNAFHEAHPDCWDAFVRYAFELIARGYRHGGARAVFERIRWQTPAGGDGVSEFKLNNNFAALYARRFARVWPSHSEFFRTRVQLSRTTTEEDTEGQ